LDALLGQSASYGLGMQPGSRSGLLSV
jgi:hypothetical protein